MDSTRKSKSWWELELKDLEPRFWKWELWKSFRWAIRDRVLPRWHHIATVLWLVLAADTFSSMLFSDRELAALTLSGGFLGLTWVLYATGLRLARPAEGLSVARRATAWVLCPLVGAAMFATLEAYPKAFDLRWEWSEKALLRAVKQATAEPEVTHGGRFVGLFWVESTWVHEGVVHLELEVMARGIRTDIVGLAHWPDGKPRPIEGDMADLPGQGWYYHLRGPWWRFHGHGD